MREQEERIKWTLVLLGVIPVTWFGLRLCSVWEGGLISLLQSMEDIFSSPWKIRIRENSVRSTLCFLVMYLVSAAALLSSKQNMRNGEEHGSARWGDPHVLNRKYAGKGEEGNKTLTRNVRMGLNSKRHGRNLNVLVCGGSGSGKTRYYAKANILNSCQNSLIVLDPKGELVRDTGKLLQERGYQIRVLDLIHMERSHSYNPFVYLKDDNDVQRLVTNLYQNTSAGGRKGQDPFWDQAGMMLLSALMFYLKYEAREEEQNFSTVLFMIRAGEVKENDDSYQSPLDKLFSRLENKDPDHIALKYYRSYRSGAAKTLKSIQITLLARLEKFNLNSLTGITNCDEMELDLVGERKTAVFAVIPDNDSSFNFIVGLLYTQLFQQLYYRADTVHGGALPVHVHFLMDEFANVALPDSFDKILATMRSREISVSILIQSMAQLKALFEKQWESILGNCDTFLYLGGNEESTHEYVSKLLGKETIGVKIRSSSKGSRGGGNESLQITGRSLLAPDEIRQLDNRYALLFIRGERPVKDLKYDILRHRDLIRTADGGAGPFQYGEDTKSFGSVRPAELTEAVEELEEISQRLFIVTETQIYEYMEEKDREYKEKSINEYTKNEEKNKNKKPPSGEERERSIGRKKVEKGSAPVPVSPLDPEL